jgi:hypothetical protein
LHTSPANPEKEIKLEKSRTFFYICFAPEISERDVWT